MNLGTKTRNRIYILILAAILLSASVVNITLPGLYTDAVNPDYWSTGLLWNKIGNPIWILPHIGYPFITQMYHGTNTFLFGTPFYLLFGTSAVTLRVVNSLYGLAAVILSYILLKKFTGNLNLSFLVSACLASDIALTASFRTQLYILVPGSVCLLASIYFMLKISENPSKNLLISGFFAGLAFYTYFVYIFFAPAFFIMLVLKFKNKKTQVFKWIFGFIVSASLYLLGYWAIVLKTGIHSGIKQITLYLGSIAILLVLLWVPFRKIFRNEFWSKKLKCFYTAFFSGSLLLFVVFTLLLICKNRMTIIINTFKLDFGGLNVTGTQASFFQGIVLSFQNMTSVLTNSDNEQIIFQRTTSNFGYAFYLITAFFVIVAVVIAMTNKSKYENEAGNLGLILLLIASFFIVGLPFSSRLGGHHFFSILVLSVLLLGVSVDIVLKYIVRSGHPKIGRLAVSIVLVVLLSINIFNQAIFQEELVRTGGVGMYTEQLNVLAENAYRRAMNGNHEIYIFPEWGFMTEFNFLTKNSVPYILNMDPNTLQILKSQKKKLILCCWTQEEVDRYTKTIKACDIDIDKVNQWKDRVGNVEFYSIECN